MLLSWRERYIAVLGHNRVGLCRRQGREMEWLGSSGFEEGEPPLATLERLLLERGKPGARLQVLLASSYIRVFLVPWHEQINSPTELLCLAQICFDDIYGGRSGEWVLRLSPERKGMPRLASAIMDELVLGLSKVATACSLKLVSVQPYLMAAFNCFRTQLSDPSFLFVVAEQGRSTLLAVHEGRWISARVVRGPEGGNTLSQLIERECLLHRADGMSLDRVYLHAPGQDDASTQHDEYTRTLSLPLPKMAMRDALYVMAQAVG